MFNIFKWLIICHNVKSKGTRFDWKWGRYKNNDYHLPCSVPRTYEPHHSNQYSKSIQAPLIIRLRHHTVFETGMSFHPRDPLRIIRCALSFMLEGVLLTTQAMPCENMQVDEAWSRIGKLFAFNVYIYVIHFH